MISGHGALDESEEISLLAGSQTFDIEIQRVIVTKDDSCLASQESPESGEVDSRDELQPGDELHLVDLRESDGSVRGGGEVRVALVCQLTLESLEFPLNVEWRGTGLPRER